MKADAIAIQNAQRIAYNALRKDRGMPMWEGRKDERKITCPSVIQQERAYATTTTNYDFVFASKSAPDSSATLNNVNLAANDLFYAYGIQVLYGSGANSVNRVYYSRGFTPDDDALYNATMEVSFESSTPVYSIPMLGFREEGEFHQHSGFQLITPLRKLSGDLSTMTVNINLSRTAVNIGSGVTLTGNGFILVRLWGAQARP